MAPPDPSLTTLHIREAMPADVPALIALDSVAAHDPRRARQISDWQASGGVHVAERAGQLAGYLGMRKSSTITSSAKPSSRC